MFDFANIHYTGYAEINNSCESSNVKVLEKLFHWKISGISTDIPLEYSTGTSEVPLE